MTKSRTRTGRLLPAAVHRFWDTLRKQLVERGLLTETEAARAALSISNDPGLRDTPRHYAAAENGGAGPVLIHRAALRLPPESVLAILCHEMGHVIHKSAFYRDNVPRDAGPQDPEQRADYLAEKFLNVRIRYDGNEVQTLEPDGEPRPEGLR